MKIKKKETLALLFIILISWIVFLFSEQIMADKEPVEDNNPEKSNTQIVSLNLDSQYAQTDHGSAQDMTKYHDSMKQIPSQEDQYNRFQQDITEVGLSGDNFDISNFSGYSYDNINILEKIYKNNKNPQVLKLLISNYLADYEFSVAREYLADVDIFTDNTISIKDYIYTYINTLSITDPNSINKFNSFLDQAKSISLISTDDYTYYQGLIYLRNNNYDQALSTLQKVSSPIYKNFINQLSGAISTYKNQQGAPEYYEAGLVALTCMKNGYFSLAEKLAIDAALKNDKYILPYQILSYSSFITKNWDKAQEYLNTLSSLDIENKNKYDFYLGISYYRGGNYEKSVTTLMTLLTDDTYKNDVYRYLLLNYEKLGKAEKMVQIWQKQLGEYKLIESDFKYFFDKVLYDPFITDKNFSIYTEYSQMVYDFIATCYAKYGEKNDSCIYGEVGLDIANKDRNEAKDEMLYLADNYPQASIFQALGNYYLSIGDEKKAKVYFLKAISFSSNGTQKMVIQKEILDMID